MPYAQEVPTMGSSEVLGSYRGGGSAYAYTPASKAYYPAMHAYSSGYSDEFEFGLGVPSPAVMNSEPSGMLPGQWSGARAKPPPFSSIYLDTYSGLIQRPSHSVNSDSTNFSFSGVAASLPLSGTPGPDRLLPNPHAAGRSSTLPYPTTAKPTASSSSTPSTLADVATAASYTGGFGTPGLSYSSAASSLSSHPSSSSRSTSDTYQGPEVIFGEQERGLQNQGAAAFDMNGYTSSPRRASAGGGDSGGGSHAYVPGESAHEGASGHHLSAGYLNHGTSSPIIHRHGLPLASGSGSSGYGTPHTDDRHVAVASRH